jgi:SAM-dependent methyltransferase
MPNPSSACDPSSFDRAGIAHALYIGGGARDASSRCDTNDRLGTRDLFAELARSLRLDPHHTLVDVCCGAGQHLVKYTPLVARAIGYDFSAAAVAEARARGVDAAVADAAALPLDDASVDAVSCAFGVYYLHDPHAAIREWARVLRPGGRVVICGPARDTNVELYEFHRQATGADPSDADRAAWGYVDDIVAPALRIGGFADVTVDLFVNPIEFPDAQAFLDYWTHTSLFLRSTGASSDDGARVLAVRPGPFRITKRESIAHATCA